MPLDHYVSQVHLRQFVAAELGNRMYAISKSSMKEFTPNPRDVCRIEGGSTNEYLEQERAVEEFLTAIEPNYTKALDSLLEGHLDASVVLTLAGFAAYVFTCSPAGMRINSAPVRSTVEAVARILEKRGELPPPPPELGASTMAELIERARVKVEIDPKYPQAIGITQVADITILFGNCAWEVLRNESGHSPFFTSDFPVVLEPTPDPLITNKVVPLSPDLAIRICPSRDLDQEHADSSCAQFSYRPRKIDGKEVRRLNQLIVRGAEDFVFYKRDLPWITRFIERNRHFRTECSMDRVPAPDGGEFVLGSHGISPFQRK